MTAKKLTRAEAVKVLVVSHCLQDLKRKQLDEVEAIEHMITHIYAKVKDCIIHPTPLTSRSTLPARLNYTSKTTPEHIKSATISNSLDAHVRPTKSFTGNKSGTSKTKPLKVMRKRLVLQSDANTANPSVIEKNIGVDPVAKKAMLVEEQQQTSNKVTRSMSPTQARKRSHAHGFSPIEQCPPSSVSKRPRGI